MRDVLADLDVAEEAKPGPLGDPLERARDRLQVRMVGRDAEPDEPPRRRQPLDQVHLGRRIRAREQVPGRVEGRGPGADDGDAEGQASAVSLTDRHPIAVRKAALGTLIALVAVLAAGAARHGSGSMWWESRLPGTYNVMDHGQVDFGGGSEISHAHMAVPCTGPERRAPSRPARGEPDASFTLTAQRATIELASGRPVDALTFDGRSPGPELRVQPGRPRRGRRS